MTYRPTGKSALAAGIRAACPRGVAIVGHDQLRREILHVRDCPGKPAAGYLDLSARYALDSGLRCAGRRCPPPHGDRELQAPRGLRRTIRCCVWGYEACGEPTLVDLSIAGG